MNERALKEPVELTDAELELVSGGLQSLNGFLHALDQQRRQPASRRDAWPPISQPLEV